MAYTTGNKLKNEQKKGFDAVEALLADSVNWPKHVILAHAKLHLNEFVEMDEMDDATFCDTMDRLRRSDVATYRVFWWWRKANLDAVARGEADGYIIKEPGFRAFKVIQFKAKPFSPDWEPDRSTLKPGVVPLITDEQIISGCDHRSIKRWMWCWHTDDYYTEEDEAVDATSGDGLIKAGDKKFDHAHIALEVSPPLPVSTICRWFGVPPFLVKVLRGKGAFIDWCEYLPHESPKAIEEGKTHYDDDVMHASPGFDFRKELDDLKANRERYGKRAGEMTTADTLQSHVLHDGWTLRQCRERDPLSYIKVRNKLPGVRLDYLQDHVEPCPFRMNIYIDGPGSVGKSAFSEYLAETMFPNYDHPYFAIGGDDRVTFDGYEIGRAHV